MKNCFIRWGVCVGLAVLLLTGCGGEYTDVSSDWGAASGGAVSGEAVSGGAIEEKKLPVSDGKKNRYNWFYSDTNFYYMTLGYGTDGFVEYNLETGTERKIKRENFWQLCYVDKDWVYYVINNINQKKVDELCRAPIEDNQVNLNKEEHLFSDKEEIVSGIYCDGRYLLYESGREYRKYDLKKKRDIGNYKRYEDSTVLAVVDGYVYLRLYEAGVAGLYRQKLDSEKMTRITKGEIWGTALAVMGGDVYYSEDAASPFCIMKYHSEDGSKEVAVSEKQLEKMFRENHLPDGKGPDSSMYIQYDPAGMFACGNRLYIQMQVGWEEKNGLTGCKNIVFYLEPEKDGELHYEKELTECMLYEHPYYAYVREYYSRGRCVEITEEKCYIEIYNPQTDKNTLGCYDFGSKKFRYMTQEDRDWNLSWYVAPHFMMEKLWDDMPGYKDSDWEDMDMY